MCRCPHRQSSNSAAECTNSRRRQANHPPRRSKVDRGLGKIRPRDNRPPWPCMPFRQTAASRRLRSSRLDRDRRRTHPACSKPEARYIGGSHQYRPRHRARFRPSRRSRPVIHPYRIHQPDNTPSEAHRWNRRLAASRPSPCNKGGRERRRVHPAGNTLRLGCRPSPLRPGFRRRRCSRRRRPYRTIRPVGSMPGNQYLFPGRTIRIACPVPAPCDPDARSTMVV